MEKERIFQESQVPMTNAAPLIRKCAAMATPALYMSTHNEPMRFVDAIGAQVEIIVDDVTGGGDHHRGKDQQTEFEIRTTQLEAFCR